MDDLAEVAGVDVAPGIALSQRRVGDEPREPAILVRLDHVADTQRVDVGLESLRERPRGLLVDELGEAVAIHRIDVVILVQGK